jgi:peptidoglycan endopeptidase LytE
MVNTSKPDKDGKIVHTVQAYQTLTTIAQAYGVSIQTILSLNGLQIDWPLQIEQKLVINLGSVTPSPTPRPLTPIEKLTPESDGNYYHTVKSGETLLWIADLYEISLSDLMAWNGLNVSSIIRPDQKLLLKVTPPASETPIPLPTTATSTMTAVPATLTATAVQPQPVSSPTVVVKSAFANQNAAVLWFVVLGLAGGGLLLVGSLLRRKE